MNHQYQLNLNLENYSMTPTQSVAYARAKVFLKACGLHYAVKMPDGTVEGVLLLAPDKPDKAPVTRKRTNDYAGPTGYPAILDTMQPGDCHVFNADTAAFAEGLRGTISAAGCKRWGNGNVITAITGRDVEVLRVA